MSFSYHTPLSIRPFWGSESTFGVNDSAVRKHIAPYRSRIYDSACGSAARFLQSENFVESHGGISTRKSANRNRAATWRDFRGAKDYRSDIAIYGQESNATTRRL